MGKAWSSEAAKPKTQFDYIRDADELADNGDVDGALACYQLAIEIQPTYYLPYMRRAQLCMANSRHQEALLDLEDVLRCHKDDYDAIEARAECFEQLGEDELAVMELARIPAAVRKARKERVHVDPTSSATEYEAKYGDFERKAHRDMQQHHNVMQFVNGNRHHYVRTANDERQIAQRRRIKDAMARFEYGPTEKRDYIAVDK